MKSDVLFVAENSLWSNLAHQFAQTHFDSLVSVFWTYGDPLPHEIATWSGRWILSFKSDLILPEQLLRQAEHGGINFHPGPPKYRGIGGHFWAIESCDVDFGVTCHHMIERVDFGPIIDVRRFSIVESDTPTSLKQRADAECLTQFFAITSMILDDRPLPISDANWGPHLYTRSELSCLLAKKSGGD